MDTVILTTGSTIPNYEIEEILEIVSVNDDRFRSATLIEESQKYGLELLKKVALKKGADAVIGIQFQYHNSMRLIFLGTLVKLKRKE